MANAEVVSILQVRSEKCHIHVVFSPYIGGIVVPSMNGFQCIFIGRLVGEMNIPDPEFRPPACGIVVFTRVLALKGGISLF